MNSLKACIMKEIKEGVKTHKFLILAMGILFFAVADPVFLKLTPMILESQFGKVDPSILKSMDLSQKGALIKYANDLFQLGMLITAFTLSGLISSEVSNKTLTVPFSMGCRVSSVIISKISVYGIFIVSMNILGMLIAYFYGGVIFGYEDITIFYALKAGIYYGILFMVMLSILIFFSTLFKKGFLSGIICLLTIYLMAAVGPLFDVEKYLPSNLTKIALTFNSLNNIDIIITLLSSVVISVVMLISSIERLKKSEVF